MGRIVLVSISPTVLLSTYKSVDERAHHILYKSRFSDSVEMLRRFSLERRWVSVHGRWERGRRRPDWRSVCLPSLNHAGGAERGHSSPRPARLSPHHFPFRHFLALWLGAQRSQWRRPRTQRRRCSRCCRPPTPRPPTRRGPPSPSARRRLPLRLTPTRAASTRSRPRSRRSGLLWSPRASWGRPRARPARPRPSSRCRTPR